MSAIPPSIGPNNQKVLPPINSRDAKSRLAGRLNPLDLPTQGVGHAPIKKAAAISSRDLDALDVAEAKGSAPTAALTEAQEIANRNRVEPGKPERLWECVGREPNEAGGFVYKYRLRDKYNSVSGGDESALELVVRMIDLNKQSEKLFPAVEPTPTDLVHLFAEDERPDWAKDIISENSKSSAEEKSGFAKDHELARRLGYAIKEVAVVHDGEEFGKEIILAVPDREAILANWKGLQDEEKKSGRELGTINIASSEGVADDLSFVQMYFFSDVVLSTGPEFLHDSIAHVISTLRLVYDSGVGGNPTYTSVKRKMINEAVLPYYQRIVKIRKGLEDGVVKLSDPEKKLCARQLDYVTTILGGVVDITTAVSNYEDFKNFRKESVDGLIRTGWSISDDWGKYILDRYPDIEEIDTATVWMELGKLEDEIDKQRDMANHDGVLWKCVDRKPNDNGKPGFVYKFQLRTEFDNLSPNISEEEKNNRKKNAQEAVKRIFPAIEPTAADLAQLYVLKPGETYPPWVQEVIKIDTDYYKNYQENKLQNPEEDVKALKYREKSLMAMMMGYQLTQTEEGVFLEVPDREALTANWEKIRETLPELKEANLASSEGVAGDLEFVEQYFLHDALISNGKEFIHDHFFHVLPTLVLLMRSGTGEDKKNSYVEEKARLVKLMRPFYEHIIKMKEIIKRLPVGVSSAKIAKMRLHIKSLEVNLGALADLSAAQQNFKNTETVTGRYVHSVFKGRRWAQDSQGIYEKNKEWGPFLKEQYGDVEVSEAFKLLREIEADLNITDKALDDIDDDFVII